MKQLGEGMKKLPINLKYLELNFTVNNLGANSEIMKLLVEGMKQLPNKLKDLKLVL